MSRYFIVGAAESRDLWFVDTALGEVRKLDRHEDEAALADNIDVIHEMQAEGVVVNKGVSVAIAIDAPADIASHHVFASHHVSVGPQSRNS